MKKEEVLNNLRTGYKALKANDNQPPRICRCDGGEYICPKCWSETDRLPTT